MLFLTQTFVALVGIQHLIFMVLEMFFWDHPIGRKIFKTSVPFSSESRALAANQGLYNGFLAAGCFWSLLANESLTFPLMFFFLSCIFVAGIFGALTVSRAILFVQAAPAFIGLILIFLVRGPL
ncbi:MAG: DUF1304 domain-containing protein [Bdellovibrionales bacterium]|nr:DUF1304 domain-containing protein [Bdellovibrionales bacterium]